MIKRNDPGLLLAAGNYHAAVIMKQSLGIQKKKWKRNAVIGVTTAVLIVALFALYDRYGTYFKRSSIPQTEYTAPVPKEYDETCEQTGTVIEIDYPSKDYTADKEITKTAYVYLPYGYDSSGTERYDVLYMVHGWMMRAQDYLQDEFQIRSLFDHMIANGDTKPFIAVCLTFDAENEPQTYERSVEELALFHYELRNDVIPYVEQQLSTYAQGTDLKSLKASREHRAFAGFSMGAVTTWHQFIFNLDLIHSFIPMSGDSWITGQSGGLLRPDQTVNQLIKPIHRGLYRLDDYFIYAGVGALDPMYEQTNSQIQEMMTRQEFSAENLVYGIKEDGYHDMTAVREFLYHALPRIFPAAE